MFAKTLARVGLRSATLAAHKDVVMTDVRVPRVLFRGHQELVTLDHGVSTTSRGLGCDDLALLHNQAPPNKVQD